MIDNEISDQDTIDQNNSISPDNFLAIDSSRATLREYSWGTPFLLMPIAMIIKLFRLKLPSSSDDPPVREIEPFQVDKLPDDEVEQLVALRNKLENLDFIDPIYHRIEDCAHATLINWITFRHKSGKAFARIHYRNWSFNQKPKVCVFPIFTTELNDGRFIVSSAGKPDTLAPSSWTMNRKKNMPCEQLWNSHQELIEKESWHVRLMKSIDDLRNLISRHHAAIIDFHLKRGFFAELSEDDKTRFEKSMIPHEDGAEAVSADVATVISEIRREENKRSSWTSLLVIAAVTLLLFVSLGAIKYPVRFILLISVVLIFHEMGHFLVMKLLGYKNMRMFFIPFLGAAVSGRHYNVPGWKQAIVALAGPLPGLALGFAACISTAFSDSALIKEAGFMLLAINGFNLLPVMPLDGGRVLQAVLFCRHPILNVLFRALAFSSFLIIGLLLDDYILTALGVVMTMGIPMSYKGAKIAMKLRKENLCIQPNETSISVSIAARILEEIKAEFSQGLNLKVRAQMVTHIFETLNTKPPNWLISIGFIIVLFFSIGIAVLSASLMLVAKHSDLGGFIVAASERPIMSYKIGTVKFREANSSPKSFSASNTSFVVNLKDHASASKLFEELSEIAPSDSSYTLFGQSVLMTMPPQDEVEVSRWLNRFEGNSLNAFAVGDGFNMEMSLSFLMPLAIEAEDLQNELMGYFAFCGQYKLIPPWSSSWNVKKTGIKNFKRARWTYGRLILAQNEINISPLPENQELEEQLEDAYKKGNSDKVKQIEVRSREIFDSERKKRFQAILTNPNADAEIVTLYSEFVTSENSKKALEFRKQMAVRMGIAESDGKRDAYNINPFVEGGRVSREGLLLNINCYGFKSSAGCSKLIAEFLKKHKVLDVKYNILSWRKFDELENIPGE